MNGPHRFPVLAALVSTCAVTVASEASAQTFSDTNVWTSQDSYATGGIAWGDVNGDGLGDLAVSTYPGGYPPTSTNNHVFFNTGSAFEITPSWTSTDSQHSGNAFFGLLDGDQWPDLWVVTKSGAVFYPGGATGISTTPGFTVQGGEHALDGVAGDVNGDGQADLFFANQCALPCTQTWNFGHISTGGVLPQTPNWVGDNAGQFTGVALADIDGAGVQAFTHQDVGDGVKTMFWIAGAPLHAVERVLVNRGNPGLVTVDLDTGLIAFASAPPAGASIEVKYSRSGELDLVFAARPGGVVIHEHSPQGPNTMPSLTLGEATDQFRAVKFADLDRDGDLDLIAVGYSDTPLAVFTNNQGQLETTASWTSNIAKYEAQEAVVRDFNHDGYPDVAAVVWSTVPTVRVHLNQGGVLEKDPSYGRPWEGMSTSSVGAADYNGDGMLDLVVGRAGDPVEIFKNEMTPPEAPSVTSMTPAQVAPGSTQTVTLTGAGFNSQSRVYLDDTLLQGAQIAGSEISFEVPAGLAEGSHEVFVVNADLQAAVAPERLRVGETGEDAGVDAEVDAGEEEAAADAEPDVQDQDASPDAEEPDAQVDAEPDARLDAGVDAEPDAEQPDAATHADAGQDASAAPSAAQVEDDEGCGCATVGQPAGSMGRLALYAMAAYALVRRVRRSRRD